MTVRLREHVGPDGRLVLALPQSLADSDVQVVITPVLPTQRSSGQPNLSHRLFGSWEGDFEYPPDTTAGEAHPDLA